MNTKIPNISQTQELIRRKKKSLSDRLRSNLPQKGVALVCALGLFFVVVSDRNMTTTFDKIPVELKVPEGFALTGNSVTQEVDVKVYGRASRLKQLSRDDLGTVTITPSAHNGNVQVTLKNEMLSMPDGVKVERFNPEFININLEPIERRTVPIKTDHAFTGELAPGFQLGEVRLNPPEIEIVGAKSLVDGTSQLAIEPIDLTGKASTFSVQRWAILNSTGIKASTSDRVEVTVNIVSKATQHVVLGVPIVPLNLTKTHELVPSTVDLTLVGDESSLAKIDTAHLFVTIDASQDDAQSTHARLLKPNEILVPNLPDGVGFDVTKFPSILLKVSDPADKKPQPPLAAKEVVVPPSESAVESDVPASE